MMYPMDVFDDEALLSDQETCETLLMLIEAGLTPEEVRAWGMLRGSERTN